MIAHLAVAAALLGSFHCPQHHCVYGHRPTLAAARRGVDHYMSDSTIRRLSCYRVDAHRDGCSFDWLIVVAGQREWMSNVLDVFRRPGAAGLLFAFDDTTGLVNPPVPIPLS